MIVEIVDEGAITRSAVAEIQMQQFSGYDDVSPTDEKAERIEEAESDLTEALQWLIDPITVAERDGIAMTEATIEVAEIDQYGTPIQPGPNFIELFPVCHCNNKDCDKCITFQVAPLTAASLHTASELLSDQAYDDVAEHGDEPISKGAFWNIFNEYPKITWGQDAIWRREAAWAFDDLANDLEQVKLPYPRCAAEEMALHRMLTLAEDGTTEGWLILGPATKDAKRHRDDFEWSTLREILFQDNGILNLFDDELDGIEDPDTEHNRVIRMGDYRPQTWFHSFDNMDARDPRRPFRR